MTQVNDAAIGTDAERKTAELFAPKVLRDAEKLAAAHEVLRNARTINTSWWDQALSFAVAASVGVVAGFVSELPLKAGAFLGAAVFAGFLAVLRTNHMHQVDRTLAAIAEILKRP